MRYDNFDLSILGGDGAIGYSVQAKSQTQGEKNGRLTLDPDDPLILESLDKIAMRDTSSDFLRDVGEWLYDLLFNDGIKELFDEAYGHSVYEGSGLRIRLRIEPSEIARLPWELLYSSSRQFLCTSVHSPIVRYLELHQGIRALTARLPLNMLVVIPESIDSYPLLDAEREKAQLEAALSGLEGRVQVTFLEGPVTRRHVNDALLAQHYHCLHFIGHGDFDGNRGYLLLSDGDGGADYVDDQRFAESVRNHDTMKLVVLNACHSAKQSSFHSFAGVAPQLVARGVPAVIAMQHAVSDEAAIDFSRTFYRSLFVGHDSGRVEIAASHARNELGAEYPQERDFATPVLYMRAPEGVLFKIEARGWGADLPFSGDELDTWHALLATSRREVEIQRELRSQRDESEPAHELEQSREQSAREELARFKSRLKLRNTIVATTVASMVGLFFLSWISVFDLLTLDTRFESLTMSLGDRIAENQLHDDIALIAIGDEIRLDRNGALVADWRQKLARLVDMLASAQTAVIVFDMLFEKPREFDQEFGDAIARAVRAGTRVVLGYRAFDGLAPRIVPRLKSAADSAGLVCNGEKLWCARSVPLAVRKITTGADGRSIERSFPSLALAALRAD